MTDNEEKIVWKDVSSYSQGERGTVEPKSWECVIYGVRVWVSRAHIHYPNEWIMNSETLGFDRKRIASVDEVGKDEVLSKALRMASAEAKVKARRLVRFAALCEASK